MMKLEVIAGLVFTLFLATTLILTFNITLMEAQPETTVSVIFPNGTNSSIDEYDISDSFWINVTVENVTMVQFDVWAMGLQWNPSVLNLTSLDVGDFFSGVSYGLTPPGWDNEAQWTRVSPDMIQVSGVELINVTKGELFPIMLGITFGSANGSGTLFEAGFQVVGYGSSDINITYASILSEGEDIPLIVKNGYFVLKPFYGPTANFTYSPLAPNVNETITFDASASLPGWNGTHDVPIANYTWDFDDGDVTTVTVPVTYHAYTANGTYTVNLTVTCEDDHWLIAEGLTSNSTWQNITIQPLPPPYDPTAAFTYSPLAPNVNETITFDASASLPGWNGTHDVPIANYTWDFDDGDVTTVTVPVTYHAYTANGTYTVNLTVMCVDDPELIAANLTSNSTWQDITVVADTKAPTVSVISPENKTYSENDVPLTFTVNETTSWIGYSLDGQANVTITGNTTLSDLSDGSHHVVVYANDTAGNMGASSTVHFTVDTTPPNITNVSQIPPKENVLPEDEVKVNATVTDVSGVKQVTLNYTNGNGTWTTVDMTKLEANIWNATIPAFPYCTYVNYTIMAEDNVGNTITTEDIGYEYQYHVIPEYPTWTTILVIIIMLPVAIAIYRRRLLKTPIQ